LLARSLRWFAFPQTQFNSGAVAAMIRTEEMFADVNRNMVVLGQNLVDRQRKDAELAARIDSLQESIDGSQVVFELLRRQIDEVEARICEMERAVNARLEAYGKSAREAYTDISQSITVSIEQIYRDVTRAEERTSAGVSNLEAKFWDELRKFREETTDELRLARQRLRLAQAGSPAAVAGVPASASAASSVFDYSHFEERFRGKEEDIRRRQSFYLPILREQAPVLDVACGRGEMLELLREQGIGASGVDLDPDMVARCHDKKLPVERGDAIAYLESRPELSLGAVFSAQFVEHLPAAVYVRLIELAFSRLRAGGKLILETQNAECLAIYSQSFYLDPTHVRPVPAEQLYFLIEEAGFRDIEIHYLSPTAEAGLPQLPGDDDATRQFNKKYFGHMDYGIVGRKPGA